MYPTCVSSKLCKFIFLCGPLGHLTQLHVVLESLTYGLRANPPLYMFRLAAKTGRVKVFDKESYLLNINTSLLHATKNHPAKENS